MCGSKAVNIEVCWKESMISAEVISVIASFVYNGSIIAAFVACIIVK
jgi:hypothetical protein